MVDCHRKLGLPFVCIITILIQIRISSCANGGNDTTGVDTRVSPPAPIETPTMNKKHQLFDSNLDGVDLTIIPGWRGNEDLDNWIPPSEIQEDMPSYLAGFDNSSRPIWVMELGRYNFGKYLNGRKEKEELLSKYFRYLAYMALTSQSLKSTVEQPVHQVVGILDYAGFKSELVADRKVFNFLKKVSASYLPFFLRHVSRLIHINLNSASKIWINFHHYTLGFIKTYQFRRRNEEFYGANKYKWGPKLAKSFPVNQLPEWYGGSKDFKPVYVIG